MSGTPRDKMPVRQVSNRSRPPANTGRTATPARRTTNVNVPTRRDPFPYVMGGVIGALVIGLALAAILIATRSGGTSGTPNNGGAIPANTSVVSGGTAQPTTSSVEAVRMDLKDFKALYDDPAKRPLIIDVRTKEIYDQGHIKGSISFPEADVDARVNELPKDKLVVAYCQ